VTSATYRFGPVALRAAIDLPELTPAGEQHSPIVTFEMSDAFDGGSPQWYHAWIGADGQDWLRIGRDALGHRLEFPGLAEFALRSGGHRVLGCVHDASAETFRHLLLDQVMPLVLSHQGWCVLHAAAVAGPAGAAAFLGSTGQGKSTMAASLASTGLAAITDDTLILTEAANAGVTGHPAYPSIRVWPGTAEALFGPAYRHEGRVSELNDKVRVGPSGGLEFATSSAPLRVLYVLTPDPDVDTPRVEEIAPRDQVIEVVRHAFVLDWKERGRLRAGFDMVSRVVDRVAVRRLRFRHDYATLPALRERILEDLHNAA
jgi:hypothetical protein